MPDEVTLPHFRFEAALIAGGTLRVAGLDEVGRGPLAGPVTAAAVRLDPARIPAGLRDSKTLAPPQRQALDAQIRDMAEVCVAHATVEEIDAINILRASHLAMCRALAGLARIDFALVDGNLLPRDIDRPARAVIGGDALCLSIAAASIVAKVERDRIMADLALAHPGYGWERNAGYPTPAHRDALKQLGVTPHHRRSFAPVHQMLCLDPAITR